MRIKRVLFLTILIVVLMLGALNLQSNKEIIIDRPVNTAGHEMEQNVFDSFKNWSPERTLQDFLSTNTIRDRSHYDQPGFSEISSEGMAINQIADPVSVVFDASHQPPITSVFELQNDLSMYGVDLIILWDEFLIPNGANILLLSASALDYTQDEVDQINAWFYSEGPHLLWMTGDSDYAGAYSPFSSNSILDAIGSNLRLAADAVADDVNNDAASYRVAVQTPVCEGELSCTFTEGVGSAIFHGPSTVLGYMDGTVIDLNTEPLDGVEIIMKASSDAYALDQDLSGSELDYYPNSGIDGDFPMMAIQDMGDNKYVIASGEAIFSDYKNMYGMETEQGLNDNPEAWNGGFHEGKVLVDNVMTLFGVNREMTFDEPIYIFGNEDFINYGFPGSGTSEDPFIIEGYSITNPNDNLINIFDTDSFFVIRDNVLNGFDSWTTGISLHNVKNGIIENNFITGTSLAIFLDNSMYNTIRNNFLDSNGEGINLWESRENTIDSNEIYNGWMGIKAENEQDMVWMRFYENITATVRDSIVWQASFLDADEGLVWYYRDNLEVSLSLDGEPVYVEIWDVYQDEEGLFRFDMEFFSDPLPVGEHEFETHFILEGEEDGSAFGYVTVLENEIVNVRFWEDTTITVGDQIAWQASYGDDDLVSLEEFYPLSETTLTINEELVEVTYSEIYFDEESGQYRFDMDYLTESLDIGEYVFEAHFIEDGIDNYGAFFAVVTVMPVSIDDNNHFTGNYITGTEQGLILHNSNGNYITGNTIEGNWGDGIITTLSHRNVFTDNTLQYNDRNGMNIAGNENIIAGNIIQWNGNGIGIYDGSDNMVMYNDIFQNWNTGLELIGSSNSYISENVFHENSWGLYIANSENTIIQLNEIYDNFGDGVHLVDSPRTTISDNMISGNWGAGIWGFRETTAFLFFLDSISATDQQSIFWLADSSSPDEGYIFYEHDNLVIDLRVDGDPVEVEISEVWFDDWDEVFRYEITYESEPLALGDHIFEVSFFLEGEFDLYFEAFVNVVAAESGIDEYVITGNYLGNNGWVGIGLDNIEVAAISTNEIENNGGQGIWIGQSSQIEVSNNVVWSNWADAGINFYMTTDSVIIGNEVFDHGSNGILLEHSSSNQIMENDLYNNDAGVMFFESSENTISTNTMYFSNVGVLLIGSSYNMISLNNIFECYGGGIGLLQNSNNNMVSFNEVHDLFGEDGIGGWDSHDNSIMFNEIYNTDDAILFRYSTNNEIKDNIIHDNARGIVLTSEPFEPVQMRFYEDITISDVDTIFWQASIVDGDEGLVWHYHDNMLVELTVDGELVDVEIMDVWFDEWDGMFRYDMNYFSEPLAVGEHFFDVRFVLEGEFEMEFSALVTVIPNESSSSGNIIHMNSISDTEFNGIHLFGSDDNVISKNEITRSGFGAIALFDSHYNLIHKNDAYEHGLGIIYLSSSNHNQISLNKLEYGYAGIYLSSSHENTLLKNEISHNENAGIELHESNDNIIKLNECEENGVDGIYLMDSNNNTIFKNELSENQYGGVTLESNSNDNTIESNDIEDNYAGILLLYSNENIISKNVLEENFFGIALVFSDGNTINDNEVEGSEYGVYLYYSFDNTFSKNKFKDNTTDWLIYD